MKGKQEGSEDTCLLCRVCMCAFLSLKRIAFDLNHHV